MGLLCYVRALCTHTYSRYRCVCVCIEDTTYVCLYRVLLLLFHSLLESDKWMTQCGGAGCIISTWLNWHKKSSQKMMQTGTICEFSLIVVNKTYAQKKTRLWSLAGLLLVVFCLLSRRQTGPPKRHPWNTTDIYLFFVCWPRTPILCPWLVQEGFFGPLQLPRTTKTSSPRWQFYCWDLFVVLGGFHLTGLFYNFVSFGCHSRKPAVLHWDR